MTRGLTNRQAEVLAFIQEFQAGHGYPPTVREVAARFGFRSPRAAHDHMKALEKKGYLRSIPRLPRTLEVVGGKRRSIPLLGRIVVGPPVLAMEEAEYTLDLDPAFFGMGRFFALQMRGDSIVDDHIQEGDMIILRAQAEAQPGQVVAVIMDDEVTLKHFHPSQDGVESRAANPAVNPIRVKSDQPMRILGVMAGLVRKI